MRNFITAASLLLVSALSFKANAQETTKLNGKDILHNLVVKHIQETKDPLLIEEHNVDSVGNGSFMIMGGGVHGKESDAVEYLVLMKGHDARNNKKLDIDEIENGELHYYTQDSSGEATETTYLFERDKNGGYQLFTAKSSQGETGSFGNNATMTQQIFTKNKKIGDFDNLTEVIKEMGRITGQPKTTPTLQQKHGL